MKNAIHKNHLSKPQVRKINLIIKSEVGQTITIIDFSAQTKENKGMQNVSDLMLIFQTFFGFF